MVLAEKTFASDKSVVRRIEAYKVLLRTRDPDVLNYVLNLGFDSDVGALKAAALRCRFIAARILTVQTLPYAEAIKINKSLSDSEAAVAEKGYKRSFSVFGVSVDGNCLFLKGGGKEACEPRHTAVLSDQSVSIVWRDNPPVEGTFRLSDRNRLVGEITQRVNRKIFTLPAELLLH
ncbi:MAG: hypothetical protein KDG52_09175 [Rhodocyclaceae bacterium]|nr:hypothetical protein [Rhodocyclaceae bacterium]